MLTCENCKTAFEASGGLAEVASLRVLCPACMRERRLARARPGPAAEPVRAANAQQPAPRPEAPEPARPAPPRPVPARALRPQPEAAAPARPRASREAAAEARSEAKKEAKKKDLASRDLKNKKNREVLFAFGGAFLVLIIAGGVLWKVVGKKREEAAIRQAQADRVAAFQADFDALDITTVEGAQRAIAFAEENKPLWETATFSGNVVGRTAKAKTFLDVEQERATLTERVNAIEQDLQKGDALTPADLADLRRRLDDLSSKVPVLGADFVARLAHDREQAESLHAERMLATAREAAAVEPLDRAALTRIQDAEDGILKIYEAAYKAWQKDAQDPVIAAKKEQYETAYQELIELSDQAVEQFFTPAVIDGIPWRDLLSAEEASHWKGASLKGFEYRVENGVMHLIGPAPEEKSEGIISIGDKEVWRDFVVDAEFTLVRGSCTVFYRLPLVWQENVEASYLTTDEGKLTAGVAYEYQFSLIGSTLIEERLGADSDIQRHDVRWLKVRKGALALAVPKESEVKFTRLRIKLLR